MTPEALEIQFALAQTRNQIEQAIAMDDRVGLILLEHDLKKAIKLIKNELQRRAMKRMIERLVLQEDVRTALADLVAESERKQNDMLSRTIFPHSVFNFGI